MQQPKPYFRKFDGWWYVQLHLNGKRKQYKLVKGLENESDAWQTFHRLMAAPRPVQLAPVTSETVVALLDVFLGHCIEVRAEATANWYRYFLTSFAKFIGSTLTVEDLRTFHVTDWLKTCPKWSSTTKHDAVQAVRACFRWHWTEGRIAHYPLNGLKAPKKKRREVVVSPQQFADVLDAVKDIHFRLLLRFLYLTGCRPQEATSLCKKHVQLELSRVVFPPSEAKGQEYPRVIYLNDEAKQIVAGLLAHRIKPDDRIFLNSHNKPWNRNSVRCRFRRLRDKIGSLCAYHLRHSFATNALQRLDPITVSVLMGHSDASTVARTYQHLAKNPEFLIDAARKASGG
ncbi:MAG: tyrosine-type recombinase/integrase [Planctomycetaceae bacterium]